MDEVVKWIVMKRDMSVVVGLISERLPDLNATRFTLGGI